MGENWKWIENSRYETLNLFEKKFQVQKLKIEEMKE